MSVLHKSLTVTEAATLSSTLNVTKEATFNHNVVVSGDLTVNGTTHTINTTNTAVKDALMELSHGLASNEAPSSDSGFIIERGSSQNVFMGWDESADMFIMGKTNATGESTGDLVFESTLCNLKADIVGQTASLSSILSVVGATTLQSTLNVSKAVTDRQYIECYRSYCVIFNFNCQ